MNLVRYKTGLIVGVLLALCHFVWLILVYVGVAQGLMDWIFGMHMLNNPLLVQPFNFSYAGMLLLVTFVVGYIVGWVIALLCNLLHKK